MSDIDGRDWLGALLDRRELTPKGLQVARYLQASPRAAAFGAASEVAGEIGVNPATVVRFAQQLGFMGWPDFQRQLRQRYLSTLLPWELMREQGATDAARPVEAALQRDIQNLRVALETVRQEDVEAVARLIAGARRTIVVSAGSYAAVGLVLSHLAQFMGYPVELETRGGAALVAALAGVGKGDCVVGISFWRLAKDVVRAVEVAGARGAGTVAITDSRYSPLEQAAGHTLVVPTDGISFFQSAAAGISVVYGLLATLQEIGGEEVRRTIRSGQQLYGELEVLST